MRKAHRTTSGIYPSERLRVLPSRTPTGLGCTLHGKNNRLEICYSLPPRGNRRGGSSGCGNKDAGQDADTRKKIRIIQATVHNGDKAMSKKPFHQDIFHFFENFLQHPSKHNKKHDQTPENISTSAIRLFQNGPVSGNQGWFHPNPTFNQCIDLKHSLCLCHPLFESNVRLPRPEQKNSLPTAPHAEIGP